MKYIQTGIDKSSGMIYNVGNDLNKNQTERINEMIKYRYKKTHLFLKIKIQKYFIRFIDEISTKKEKEYFFDSKKLEQIISVKIIKPELLQFWKDEILVTNLIYF